MPDGDWGHLIALRYDGRYLWQNRETPLLRDITVRCDIVILMGLSPGFGRASRRDPEAGSSTLQRTTLLVHDTRTGARLWTSNMRDFGDPIWSNGKVIFSILWDFSPKVIQHVSRGAKVPVSIRQYRARDGKLLWQKRLAGDPPRLGQVVARGRRHALCIFPEGQGWGAMYVNNLKSLEVKVSLLAGKVIPARDMAVTYRD